jgi:hypothetical protein
MTGARTGRIEVAVHPKDGRENVMPNTDIFLARSLDADRDRGSARRHEIARARRDGAAASVPSRWRAVAAAASRFVPSLDRSPWGEPGRSSRGSSFLGAFVLSRPADGATEPAAAATDDEELRPIRDGALAAWARSGSASAERWLIDQPCRMPDGRVGRTAVIEEAGRRELVCVVA